MKFLSTAVAFAAALTGVQAATKGLNIGANNDDGSCKTTAQWENAFKKIKHLPNKFRSARLYASSDCNTLLNAVPAAKRTGVKLLVGVWATDDAHFGAEKAALQAAIRQYGHGWIHSISVGSEDLYRKDNDPNHMADQIHDVRGMVRSMGVKAKVGHVDTWTAWVDGANIPVIKACDFIGMDAYPYFQGATIENAKSVFFQALDATRNAVKNSGHKAPVWVTETAQPVHGDNFGASTASKAHARTYFKAVGCALFKQGVPTWWYAYQDDRANPSFGVFGGNGKPTYSLKC